MSGDFYLVEDRSGIVATNANARLQIAGANRYIATVPASANIITKIKKKNLFLEKKEKGK